MLEIMLALVGGIGVGFLLGGACLAAFLAWKGVKVKVEQSENPGATKPKPKLSGAEKLLAKLRAEEEKKPIPPKPKEFDPPPKEDIVLVDEYYALVNEDLASLGIDSVRFNPKDTCDKIPQLYDARERAHVCGKRDGRCLVCGRSFEHEELVLFFGKALGAEPELYHSYDYCRGAYWYGYCARICVDRKACRKYAESKGRDLRHRSGRWCVSEALSDTRMAGIKTHAKSIKESPEGLTRIVAQLAAQAKDAVKAKKSKQAKRKSP